MVAGSATTSKSDRLRGGVPDSGSIRGINAFTLGVQAINPDAEVEVIWTSTWFDPAVEGDSAQALLDKGADVIAMHQDSLLLVKKLKQRVHVGFPITPI